MKILFDLDSLIYAALYKCVTFSEIKQMYKNQYTRLNIENKIILEANERLANMCLQICENISSQGFEFGIEDVEYFITSNIFSFRKQISTTYKANRKGNKWANKLREYIMENENCNFSLDLESDDLIFDRAKELNYNCVVCTIDKDLNQIKGFKYDLYREKTGVLNEFGIEQRNYRGLKFITDDVANLFVWHQMLVGDMSDNIKGIKGIGEKRASNILSIGLPFWRVARLYFNEFGGQAKEIFKINYRLLRLGSI